MHFESVASAILTAQGDWPETTGSTDGGRRRQESGGIDLSEHFQQSMSVSGGVSEMLIDSEFSYVPAKNTKPSTWREVASTKSWHTDTQSSTHDSKPQSYGKPSTHSVSGSDKSFNSSIAERSQSGSGSTEVKNGFAKIKAYVSVPDVLVSREAKLTSKRSLSRSCSKRTSSPHLRIRPRMKTTMTTTPSFRKDAWDRATRRISTQGASGTLWNHSRPLMGFRRASPGRFNI